MVRNKKILWLIGAAALLAAVAMTVPWVIHRQIERALAGVFPDAYVSVGRLSIERPLAAAVSDVRVEAEGYRVTVDRVRLDRQLHLTLERPNVRIQKIPASWRPAPSSGPAKPGSPARLDSVRLSDLTVEFKLPDFKGRIQGDAEIDLGENRVRSARLEAPSIRSGAVKIEKVALHLPGTGAGTLTADRIGIGRLRISDWKGDVMWEDTTIVLKPIVASSIRGAITGQAQVLTQDPFAYDAEFEIRDLDLAAFAKEMKFADKMTADGKVAGRISVSGDLAGVNFLKGSFASEAAGGSLIIQDPEWLKYLADNTRQPMGLVEAAFREYRFDSAAATMAASGRDLKFAVRMNGVKGRRDFDVNLHDWL